MGIFDEAIREHLDLKRRQGVDEGELKELEDEAFGLPARPGDEPAEAPEEAPAEQMAEPEAPQAEAEAPPAEPPATAEEPSVAEEEPEAVPEPVDEEPPHGDALLADPEAEPEPAPAGQGPVPDESARFTTTEREAIADKPTEFFDQTPEPLELGELDLDLDEELDEVGSIEEPVIGEEPVEPEASDPQLTEPELEREPAPEPDEPSVEGEPEAAGDEGEDVLEETPEFLRENPDDDELWFEQGKPKDFDF